MSWLFSRALVEAFSEGISSDGAPSALSSGSPTPQAFLPPDRMTAFSRPSRSGMTFSPLTADLGEAVLTWCQEASRARTSASPAREQASTEPAAACGVTWRASLARFDPATSSWRTAQPSLLEDWGESSVTWPRSGMTAGGQCWELAILAPRIKGTGSGLWPTPTSQGHDAGGTDPRRSLYTAVRATCPTPTVCGNYNRKGASATSGDGLATAVMKWPTPTASAMPCEGTQRIMRKKWLAGELSLEEASAIAGRDVRKAQGKVPEMWPTPIASDSRGSSGKPAPGKQTQLVDAVRFATPLSRDWRSGKTSQATAEKNSRPLSEQIGGSLNPTWVEWLMGWPLGWTDLKPLETAKCHCAPQQHGKF